MLTTFQFKIQNHWDLETALIEKQSGGSLKTHQVFLEDGKTFEVSAAKAFKGDASKYNPEELLMAALSSCHFMSYIYVCEQAGIFILKYSDNVEGFLKLNDDGSGAFTKIILKPKVTIKTVELKELAEALHTKAGRLCFIANSCAFEIEYKPRILIE
ncbi:OsmC family protein [Formosa sp. PL04]|uniref:OsmC family protein n=1 Tax=Formosa sp. PL04 TaxID=3081755 RepID=UPI002981C31B|nr:OsmC family protein [Formosa sp. PL04]MDW5291019.1 OsmC family protein [Formosa sp. PL04]